MIRADSLSVGAQIAVVVPRCDGGKADILRVDLDEWHSTVLGHSLGETGFEALIIRCSRQRVAV